MDQATEAQGRETADNCKPELKGIAADLTICLARVDRLCSWMDETIRIELEGGYGQDHEAQRLVHNLMAELLRINERVLTLIDYDYTPLLEDLQESREALRQVVGVGDEDLDRITHAMDLLR